MKLIEQILKNNRTYWHGCPHRITDSYIKGEQIDNFTVGFITTNKMYAAKYALDQKENNDNTSGYLYRVEFTNIPNIFEPNNPTDIFKWKQHYSVSANWSDLELLKNTDWLFSTRFAFSKDRTETMRCLHKIGFDGFSCNERTKPDENYHSIGVFDCETKLKIIDEINLNDYKNEIDNSHDGVLQIFYESKKIALDLYLGKIQEAISETIPNRWINHRVLNNCYYNNMFEEVYKQRGFLN